MKKFITMGLLAAAIAGSAVEVQAGEAGALAGALAHAVVTRVVPHLGMAPSPPGSSLSTFRPPAPTPVFPYPPKF